MTDDLLQWSHFRIKNLNISTLIGYISKWANINPPEKTLIWPLRTLNTLRFSCMLHTHLGNLRNMYCVIFSFGWAIPWSFPVHKDMFHFLTKRRWLHQTNILGYCHAYIDFFTVSPHFLCSIATNCHSAEQRYTKFITSAVSFCESK